MYHSVLLSALGLLLMIAGIVQADPTRLSCWFGFSFLWLGIAHLGGFHRAFGKRPDGTLPIWSQLIHLPFLCYTHLLWYLIWLFSREPAFNHITDSLVVGRRLLSSELPGDFDNYVDLTTEFEDPPAIRALPGYISHPLLDGSAPSPEVLRAMINTIRPGRSYVHCAQGHGRAALFSLALLLETDTVSNVEDGLRLLKQARPAIHLNRVQRRCIEAFAQQLHQREPVA